MMYCTVGYDRMLVGMRCHDNLPKACRQISMGGQLCQVRHFVISGGHNTGSSAMQMSLQLKRLVSNEQKLGVLGNT